MLVIEDSCGVKLVDNGWMSVDGGNYFGWDSMKRVRFERLT